MGSFINNITEFDLEGEIRKYRQEFNDKEPDPNHENRFLSKLYKRFKKFISIVPYLLRVLIVTIFIFIVSVIIWDNFIRKDRHDITLKEKIISTFENTIK